MAKLNELYFYFRIISFSSSNELQSIQQSNRAVIRISRRQVAVCGSQVKEVHIFVQPVELEPLIITTI